MRWYEGDIAQAVATSKTRNAIFVVYVEGKDDKSKNLTSCINGTEVSSKLESDNFVAIKVEAGSVPHTQFAAIYTNVPVPSLFFIGKSGKPIDIITESSSSNDLSTRINSVIQSHTGVVPTPSVPASTPSVPATSAAKQSESFIQSEKQPDQPASADKAEKKEEIVRENGACVRVSPDAASTSAKPDESASKDAREDNAAFLEQEKAELSKQEKIERAKQLVEQKREEKRQQDEEVEKKKELERRKAGQEVQKMQRSQQDQELKNLMEERQRVKNEEKAARDRILAQIAQDKADRAARFGTSPPTVASSSQQQLPVEPVARTGSNSTVTRLQFRLPDGASQTQEFAASACLSEVREFISANLSLPFRHFSLSTTFPRREFSAADVNATLRDLELCPNAVILVLPAHTGGGGAVSANEGGGFMSILWLIFTPILSIFGYFRSLVFGPVQPADSTADQQPSERNKRAAGSGGEAEGNQSPQQPPQQPPTKRQTMDSTVVRRQGNSNIHRLSDRTESDDDNNTWNGNSTQQM